MQINKSFSLVNLFLVSTMSAFVIFPVNRAHAFQQTSPLDTSQGWTLDLLTQAIRDIEKPRILSFLKIRYFGQRGEPEIPFEQSLELVKISSQGTENKKWFLLHNLYAFAIFQTGALPPNQGFEAYDQVFDSASKAGTSGSTDILRLTIAEYVNLVAHRLDSLGLIENVRSKRTLFKAWNAYLLTPTQNEGEKHIEPDFVGAFRSLGVSSELKTLIEKTITNPKVIRSYSLLTSAAYAIQKEEPEQAIALLWEAKLRLPKHLTKIDGKLESVLDVNEAARFYDMFVNLLEDSKKSSDAIIEQQERVRLVNGGRGKLWLMLQKDGRSTEADIILNELKSTDVREIELVRAARLYGEVSPSMKELYGAANPAAISLWEFYLGSKLKRTFAYEIEGRYWLAKSYFDLNEVDKAKQILQFVEPEHMDPRWSYQLNQIRQLRKDLGH